MSSLNICPFCLVQKSRKSHRKPFVSLICCDCFSRRCNPPKPRVFSAIMRARDSIAVHRDHKAESSRRKPTVHSSGELSVKHCLVGGNPDETLEGVNSSVLSVRPRTEPPLNIS